MLGQDFTLKNGFRMYHGRAVPGFPTHPHRGFETVTAVLKGFVDHSDSYGAAGRYGPFDVQWMTAGAGLQHCEMFPLLDTGRDNPLELFQIWLNLPAERKFAPPHYKMLWAESIPGLTEQDGEGRQAAVTVFAGTYHDVRAPAPAPDSWAADPGNQVSVLLIILAPKAHWRLPAASPGLTRTLYAYEGSPLRVAGVEVRPPQSVTLLPEADVQVENGDNQASLLVLQGKPIGEPVAQYGPFVMNTQEEIGQAINDFNAGGFGGWPWPSEENVHPRARGRFARYADGREEVPGS
jgi:redox-sensitive bicupin YhaK (pirin superfamily)